MAVFFTSQKAFNVVVAVAAPCIYEGPLFHRQALLTVKLPILSPHQLARHQAPEQASEEKRAQFGTPHPPATHAGTEDHWQLPKVEKLMTQI